MRSAPCTMRFALCSYQPCAFSPFPLPSALCSLPFALCAMHLLLCAMPYAPCICCSALFVFSLKSRLLRDAPQAQRSFCLLRLCPLLYALYFLLFTLCAMHYAPCALPLAPYSPLRVFLDQSTDFRLNFIRFT